MALASFLLGMYVNGQTIAVASHPCSTILSTLEGARNVKLAVFLFSLYDANECTDLIAERLVNIARSGGHGEVFLDDAKTNMSVIRFFLERNIPVYIYRKHATLHAKVLLADDCYVLGSSNYTKTGFFRNAEINVKICGPSVGAVRAWFERLKSKCVPATRLLAEQH